MMPWCICRRYRSPCRASRTRDQGAKLSQSRGVLALRQLGKADIGFHGGHDQRQEIRDELLGLAVVARVRPDQLADRGQVFGHVGQPVAVGRRRLFGSLIHAVGGVGQGIHGALDILGRDLVGQHHLVQRAAPRDQQDKGGISHGTKAERQPPDQAKSEEQCQKRRRGEDGGKDLARAVGQRHQL